MKNVYSPDPQDVYEWLNTGAEVWPAVEWDVYVLSNGRNDDLIFRLANDPKCFQREFFVHAMYYMVGAYYQGINAGLSVKNRIEGWLRKVNAHSTPEVQGWKEKTMQLFAQELVFDPAFWYHFWYSDRKN